MFNHAELALFVGWIKAREELRCAKESGRPKPWTNNLTMRNVRWCNVRRLDDVVSRSLFAYWYDGLATAKSTQLVAAVFGRLINWPPSLMVISNGRPFAAQDMKTARARLHARAQRFAHHVKIFTGAYVVPGVPGKTKIDSVCDTAEAVALNSHFAAHKHSMQSLWEYLQTFDTLGSFLAGQVVADLAHLPYGEDWPDKDTWAPLGPGSRRGMNRVLGYPKKRALSQPDFEMHLRNLITELYPRITGIWEDRKLQAFDIQNCLCEFDKYRRLQLGEGTVRQSYPGEPTGGLFS